MNATTSAEPMTPVIQKPRLGRSFASTAAAIAVASGRMPITTPPCAAGTDIIASAAHSGNSATVNSPATRQAMNFSRDGIRRRITSSASAAAMPAMVMRAAVRNSGSNPCTASRVAGSVPANSTMPKKASSRPVVSRGLVMNPGEDWEGQVSGLDRLEI